jgi:ABC-type transporter MlaC component
MKQITLVFFLLTASGCDSKNETVGQGREAVKEVVTQPFNTLDSAKDSLRQSEDKQKAALEQADKENK